MTLTPQLHTGRKRLQEGVVTTRWQFSGTGTPWWNANKATRPWARRLSELRLHSLDCGEKQARNGEKRRQRDEKGERCDRNKFNMKYGPVDIMEMCKSLYLLHFTFREWDLCTTCTLFCLKKVFQIKTLRSLKIKSGKTECKMWTQSCNRKRKKNSAEKTL